MNSKQPIQLAAVLLGIITTVPLAGAESELTEVPRGADQLVEQALAAQLEGDLARRTELLHRALDVDPNHHEANWQLGYLQGKSGEWMSITQHQQLNALDDALLDYRAQRNRLVSNPQKDWHLAEWCARHGLADIATAHYTRVVNSGGYDSATRNKAMRRLGIKSFRGQLLTDEQIENVKAAEADFKKACERLLPKLVRWQQRINAQDERAKVAIEELWDFEDPQLVRVLHLFLISSGEPFGDALVTKLGMLSEQESTELLVRYAVLSPWLAVREAAIQELRVRRIEDYVPMLLGALAAPLETEWAVAEAADGSIVYQHRFYQESPTEIRQFDTALISTPVSPDAAERNWGDQLGRLLDVRRSLRAAANRERAIAQTNFVNAAGNERIYEALEKTTRAQVGRDAQAWWQWWQDYNDVQFEKQQRYGYQWQQRQMTRVSAATPQVECFVAGTPIWTATGLEPIETLQAGDRVLSQDPETGELSFKAVLNTTVRPPVTVVQLNLPSESITTTLGHPIWVAGDGWRLARHLMPGQQLHAVHGGVFLKQVERGGERASAYNLIVADFHTYFVGKSGVLVHDNLYRDPTRARVPGEK